MKGVVRTSYYFQGSSTTRTVSHTLTGPRTTGWQTTDVFDTATRTWAPCGENRDLNINTRSGWKPPQDTSATSQLGMGPVAVFRLAWKNC